MRPVTAIIVLGCRVGRGEALGGPATRRAEAALRAWRAGLAETVIASGGRRWDGFAEATQIAAFLEENGVPSSAIHRELLSLNTTENAIYSRALVDRLARATTGALHAAREHRAFVATASWHLPRALRAFRRAGFDASGLPAHEHHVGARAIAHAVKIALKERGSSLLDDVRARIPTHLGRVDALGPAR